MKIDPNTLTEKGKDRKERLKKALLDRLSPDQRREFQDKVVDDIKSKLEVKGQGLEVKAALKDITQDQTITPEEKKEIVKRMIRTEDEMDMFRDFSKVDVQAKRQLEALMKVADPNMAVRLRRKYLELRAEVINDSGGKKLGASDDIYQMVQGIGKLRWDDSLQIRILNKLKDIQDGTISAQQFFDDGTIIQQGNSDVTLTASYLSEYIEYQTDNLHNEANQALEQLFTRYGKGSDLFAPDPQKMTSTINTLLPHPNLPQEVQQSLLNTYTSWDKIQQLEQLPETEEPSTELVDSILVDIMEKTAPLDSGRTIKKRDVTNTRAEYDQERTALAKFLAKFKPKTFIALEDRLRPVYLNPNDPDLDIPEIIKPLSRSFTIHVMNKPPTPLLHKRRLQGWIS